MSITTYAELQTAVQNWLDRTEISSYVPDFITLAEAAFQRNLRTRQMVASSSSVTSSGSRTMPTDFLQMISVKRAGSPVTTLDPLDSEDFQGRYGTRDTGNPAHYTISGENLLIGPVDDTTAIVVEYYQKIPVLSVSNTTNWLLTKYPDLYLFGSLCEAEMFGKQPMGPIWKQRRDEVLNSVQLAENFNYRGPSPQVRRKGFAP